MTNGPIEQLGAEARELQKPDSKEKLMSLADLEWNEENIDQLITFLSNESNNDDFSVVSDGKKLSIDGAKKRVGSQFLVNDTNWKSYSFIDSSSQQAVLLPFLSQKNKEGGRRILDKDIMNEITIPSYMTPENIEAVNKFDEMLADGNLDKGEVKEFQKEMEALKAVFAKEFDEALDTVINSLEEVEKDQTVDTIKEDTDKLQKQVEADMGKPIKFEDLDERVQDILIRNNKVKKDSQELFYIKHVGPSSVAGSGYQLTYTNGETLYFISDERLSQSAIEIKSDAPEVIEAQNDDLENKYKDLETGVMKDVSDKMPRNMKQALRWFFKEKKGVERTDDSSEEAMLKDIFHDLKKVNVYDAFDLIESGDLDALGIEDSSTITNNQRKNIQKSLIDAGYRPAHKNFLGKKMRLTRGEIRALLDLKSTLDRADNPEAVKSAITYLQSAVSGGMNHVALIGSKRMIDQTESLEHDSVLKLLIGDLNYDGDIVNLKEGGDQASVDKGRILGGQIQKAYELAVEQHGEKKVAENIGSLVGLEVENLEELTSELKANPGKVNQLRQMMQIDSDNIERMMEMGSAYATVSMQEAVYRKEQLKPDIVKNLLKEIPADIKEMLDDKILELLNKDTSNRDDMIQSIRAQIAKISSSNEVTSDQVTHIQNLRTIDELLTTINDEVSNGGDADKLPDSLKRGFYLSAIGAGYSNITVDSAKIEGVSAMAGVSHDGWNDALKQSTANIIDNMTLGGGIYKDLNTNALGYGFSLTAGGNQKLATDTTLFYNGGGARSPLAPGNITPVVTVGIDQLLNRKSLQKTLDYRSAQHATLTGTASGGGDIAVQLSRSRDKKEGLFIGHEVLLEQSTDLFSKLIQAENTSARQEVLSDLFPDTPAEQISQLARSLEYAVSQYEKTLIIEGASADLVSERMGKAFARVRLNEGMEQISREGLHISQIGGGVSLFKAFTGFLGLATMSLSYYKPTTIEEKTENYHSNLEEGRGLNRVVDGSLSERLNALEKELSLGENIFTHDLESHTITVSASVLDKGVMVSLAPHLKDFVTSDDTGNLIIPASVTLTGRNGLRSDRREKFLAIGTTSISEKDQIKSFEGMQGNPEDYGVTLEMKKSANAELTLNGKPSDGFKNIIDEKASAIAMLRVTESGRELHKSMMDALSDRTIDAESFKVEFGNSKLKDVVKEIKDIDDMRYLHASLSKVSQTEYKHLDADGMRTQVEALGGMPSDAPEGILEGSIDGTLTDDDISYLSVISGVDNPGFMKAALTNKQKIGYLLLPLAKIASARTDKYLKALEGEVIDKDLTETGKESLKNYRELSIEGMKGQTIGKGEIIQNAVSLVSGYGEEVDEKYTEHPRFITESLVDITDPDVKKYFLKEMVKNDKLLFDHIAAGLREQANKVGVDITTHLSNADQIIEALATGVIEGEDSAKLNANFQFGFFADCINDGIVMRNVTIENKVKKNIKGEGEVYVGNAMTDHVMDTQKKTVSIYTLFGNLKTRDKSGTGPETLDEQDESETAPETLDGDALQEYLDGLDKGTINTVDGGYILTFDDGTQVNVSVQSAGGNTYHVVQVGDSVYVLDYQQTSNGVIVSMNEVIGGTPDAPIYGQSQGIGSLPSSGLPSQGVDEPLPPIISRELPANPTVPVAGIKNIFDIFNRSNK